MEHRYHTTIASALPTLLLLWGTIFISMNMRTVLGPLSEAIATGFGIRGYEVITLSSFISIGTIISLIFSGHIAFILMHKRALILALFLLILGLVCTAFAPSLALFKIGLLIIGVGAGLYPGSGIPIANRMSSESIRGNVMAIHETGPIGAFIFVPLFSSMILLVADWRMVFFLFAFMSVFLAVLVIVGCPEGYFRGSPLSFHNIRRLSVYSPFWILGAAFAIIGAVNIAVYTSMVDYLVSFKGFEYHTVTLLQSISRISGLVMIFFSGMIVSRMPAMYVTLVTGCLVGMLTILIGLLDGSAIFFVIFLQTFVVSGFFPAFLVCVGQYFPGPLQGLMVALISLLSQFVAIIINLMYRAFASTQNLDEVFLIMGACVFVVSLCILFIKNSKPLREDSAV